MSDGGRLYGRNWRVVVSSASGAGLDVTKLRCVFEITKSIDQAPNESSVTIYNLAPDTEQTIIEEGNRVVVEAGYDGDQYGVIFDGDILQAVREKEDAVTKKLTLYASDGDAFLNTNFVSTVLSKGQTAKEQIETVTGNARVSAELGTVSKELSKQKLARGKVLFGQPKKYLRTLAQSEKATFYIEDGKVQFVKAPDLEETEAVVLRPDTGLIGFPTLNEEGITATCLLNPRVKCNSIVNIDSQWVSDAKASSGGDGGSGGSAGSTGGTGGGKATAPTPSESGLYRVIKVTYKGDTHGQEWYCEIEGVAQPGSIPSIIESANQNPFRR